VIVIKETQIFCKKKPKLKNPILIVGLPGIGNVGRLAVGYMVHQLKAKKFAELYSPYFFHLVVIHEDKIHTLRNEFYYYKGKQRDLVLLIGDCQSYDAKGHYEVVGKILEFAKSLGCKEIITIGGFRTGKIMEKPKVLGAVTDDDVRKKYKNCGIDFKISGKIGPIVGAAGLLVGFAKHYKMKGICLLGETAGFPIVTDPNAAEAVLNVLQKMIKVKINLEKLHEKVEEMHYFLKKMEEIQEEALEQMRRKAKPREELKYIG
jgi:hypothetical protein